MITPRLYRFGGIFAPLLVFLLSLSTLSLAVETEVTLVLKKSDEDHVPKLKTSAVYDSNDEQKGLFARNFVHRDDQTPYVLQVRPSQNGEGVGVFLRRSPPGDDVSIRALERQEVVAGVEFTIGPYRNVTVQYYRLADQPYGIPFSLSKQIPMGQTFKPFDRATHRRSDVYLPDLMAVSDVLLHLKDKYDHLPTGRAPNQDTMQDMTHEIDRIMLESAIRLAPQASQMGKVDKNILALPAARFSTKLQPPVKFSQFTRTSTRYIGTSINLPMFSRTDDAALGLLTKPVFIKGPGDVLALKGKKAVQGDLYFLNITDIPGGNFTIRLRRLNRPTVVEACYTPEDHNDCLSLTIQDNSTAVELSSGDGSRISAVDITNAETLLAGEFEDRAGRVDKIQALNLLSKWKHQLQDDQNEIIDGQITESDVQSLFLKTGQKSKAFPHPDIIIASKPLQAKVSVGFNAVAGRHNLDTKILIHPSDPAHGVLIGPVWVMTKEQKQVPYAFHLRSTASNSYTMGMLPLNAKDLKALEEDTYDAVMFGLEPNYQASMTVTRQGSRVELTLNDSIGHVLNTQYDLRTQWRQNNRVNLIPLPNSKNAFLPGLGACMNILAQTIRSFPTNIDTSHMMALLTPQTRRGVQDGYLFSGAYRSDVPRNWEALAHYHQNTLWRWLTWAGKKTSRTVAAPVDIAYQHKCAAGGAIVIGGLAFGTAYWLDPEGTMTYLNSMLEAVYPWGPRQIYEAYGAIYDAFAGTTVPIDPIDPPPLDNDTLDGLLPTDPPTIMSDAGDSLSEVIDHSSTLADTVSDTTSKLTSDTSSLIGQPSSPPITSIPPSSSSLPMESVLPSAQGGLTNTTK